MEHGEAGRSKREDSALCLNNRTILMILLTNTWLEFVRKSYQSHPFQHIPSVIYTRYTLVYLYSVIYTFCTVVTVQNTLEEMMVPNHSFARDW